MAVELLQETRVATQHYIKYTKTYHSLQKKTLIK